MVCLGCILKIGAAECPDRLSVGVERKGGIYFLTEQVGRLICYQMRWESPLTLLGSEAGKGCQKCRCFLDAY